MRSARGPATAIVGRTAVPYARVAQGAEVVKKITPPDDAILNDPGQHIQIIPVYVSTAAAAEGSPPPSVLTRMSPNVANGHYNTDVDVFFYSRPFKKGKTGNDFRDLWVEENYVVTSSTFPSIRRRAAVAKTITREIPPVVGAARACAVRPAD